MVTIALMPHTSKAPPKPQLRKLGRRLREIRGRRKQDEIARPIGISAGYVSNLESGRYQPTTEVLEGYEKHWGADYNELAELAGLLRRRPDTWWTPPPDKRGPLRVLAEHLDLTQLEQGARLLLSMYQAQLEQTIKELPDGDANPQEKGAG